MKTKVEDIYPNPFRKLDRYPIIVDKVESIKDSIRTSEAGFWDNIVARKKDGVVELAYGHHRLEALKSLGIKQINLIIKDLSDQEMVQIMANENMDVWRSDFRVIRQTVLTAREVAEKELGDEGSLFHIYKTAKTTGKHMASPQGKDRVTADDIAWYLGPVWKRHYQRELISHVLGIEKDIEEGLYDEADIQDVLSPSKIREFRTAVRKTWSEKAKTKTEKKQRKKVIKKVLKSESGTKREKLTTNLAKEKLKEEEKKKGKGKGKPDITVYASKLGKTKVADLISELEDIHRVLLDYPDQVIKFRTFLVSIAFRSQLERLASVSNDLLQLIDFVEVEDAKKNKV